MCSAGRFSLALTVALFAAVYSGIRPGRFDYRAMPFEWLWCSHCWQQSAHVRMCLQRRSDGGDSGSDANEIYFQLDSAMRTFHHRHGYDVALQHTTKRVAHRHCDAPVSP